MLRQKKKKGNQEKKRKGTESYSVAYLVPWVWNGAVRITGPVSSCFSLKMTKQGSNTSKNRGKE